MRPSVRDDLTIIELDGEAVVYDDASGELHHLNPSATIVLSLCDGGTTVDEMVGVIAEAAGLGAGEIDEQVRTTVERFARAGLIA
jgi:PqqD family protein of HPr-rel-A system